MNGVLRLFKPTGVRRYIHCGTHNLHENGISSGQGKFVIINGKLIKIPAPPTTCCMSGCANCVYIEYAEEINEIFRDGGQMAKQIVLDSIEDSNMKAFLSMELRNSENKRKK